MCVAALGLPIISPPTVLLPHSSSYCHVIVATFKCALALVFLVPLPAALHRFRDVLGLPFRSRTGQGGFKVSLHGFGAATSEL